MSLETGREVGFGEYPSPDRLTVGTSNRLRITPRYCDTLNPLVGGERYGVVGCDSNVRDTLWWLGEFAREAGVLAGCCIPGQLGGSWWKGDGIPPDQKSAIITPTAHRLLPSIARSCA